MRRSGGSAARAMISRLQFWRSVVRFRSLEPLLLPLLLRSVRALPDRHIRRWDGTRSSANTAATRGVSATGCLGQHSDISGRLLLYWHVQPMFDWVEYFFTSRESCLHGVINEVYLQNLFTCEYNSARRI
jgi:hypothetical protein